MTTWGGSPIVGAEKFLEECSSEALEGKEPLHARSGVRLTMAQEGDKWLVDETVQLQFQ